MAQLDKTAHLNRHLKSLAFMSVFSTLIMLLLALVLIFPAAASSQSHTDQSHKVLPLGNQLKIGEASFSWLWWTVYRAQLFHPSGEFSFQQLPGTALSLTYKLNIERNDLLEQTQQQWQELGLASKPLQQQWLVQLAEIWPEQVDEGDRLVVYVNDSGQSEFWFGLGDRASLQYLGTVSSSQFSHDFLAIWLLERPQHRSFRAQLLGQSGRYDAHLDKRQADNAAEEENSGA